MSSNNEYNFSLLQKIKNKKNLNINDYITRIGDSGYVLVINNSLPSDLYNKLKDEYISLSDIVLLNNENNENNNKNQKKIMMSDFLYSVNSRYIKSTITPLWNQFIEYHKSSNFINEMFSINENNISRNTFEIELNHHSPVLYKNNNTNTNSSTEMNDVKTAFLGYYFLRDEKDNSNGFNLEIYHMDKRILSIPYQKNTFVLICNEKNDKNIKTKFSDKGFSIYSKKYITVLII
jgi:hypothetical protein